MAEIELQSTKMQIVDNAFQLYKKNGYSNVTVQDICDASEIARGTFYYYFKSKDEILDNIFLFSDMLSLDNLLSILNTDDYLEQFFFIFNIYLERTLTVGSDVFSQILKRNIDKGTPLLNPNEIAMRNIYTALIQKAQEAGQIRNKTKASDLVDAVVYIADGIGLIWCNKKGNLDFISENRRILNTLLEVNSEYNEL